MSLSIILLALFLQMGFSKTLLASSFVENQGLCGGVLIESPCMNSNGLNPSSNYSHATKKTGLTWMLAVVIVLVIAILLLGIRCFRKYYICQVSGKGCMTKENPQIPWKMTSFQRLIFIIEDVLDSLNPSTMIGIGAGVQFTRLKCQEVKS